MVHSVDLKRRPPKSLPWPPLVPGTRLFRNSSAIEEAARKDSAVHVSLSSYSLVKQPGTMAVPSPVARRAFEAPSLRPRSEALSPLSVRSFGGTLSRPSGRRRAVTAYIVPPGPSCQHLLRLAKRQFLPCHCSADTGVRKAAGKLCGRVPAPHCGHIPPPFLRIRREVFSWGSLRRRQDRRRPASPDQQLRTTRPGPPSGSQELRRRAVVWLRAGRTIVARRDMPPMAP